MKYYKNLYYNQFHAYSSQKKNLYWVLVLLSGYKWENWDYRVKENYLESHTGRNWNQPRPSGSKDHSSVHCEKNLSVQENMGHVSDLVVQFDRGPYYDGQARIESIPCALSWRLFIHLTNTEHDLCSRHCIRRWWYCHGPFFQKPMGLAWVQIKEDNFSELSKHFILSCYIQLLAALVLKPKIWI